MALGRGIDIVVADGDRARRARTCDRLAALAVADQIREAASALEAVELVAGADLVLLDDRLHDADPADAIAILRRRNPRVRVVVLTSAAGPEPMRRALDGGALSFCAHDADLAGFTATMHAALQGRGLIDVDTVRPVLDGYGELLRVSRARDRAVIESLAAAVEAKDTVTSRHLRAVSVLAHQLAGVIDPALVDTEHFHYGCLLHDVGKIGVPEEILCKPGPLTDDEWTVMRRHPATGAQVIRPLGLDGLVEDIVLHHHERWDGRGYPDGQVGARIPLGARIFSVCDALEAMTAARPYRSPLSAAEAYARVRAEAGRQFDPTVVQALDRGVTRGEIDLVAGLAGPVN